MKEKGKGTNQPHDQEQLQEIADMLLDGAWLGDGSALNHSEVFHSAASDLVQNLDEFEDELGRSLTGAEVATILSLVDNKLTAEIA